MHETASYMAPARVKTGIAAGQVAAEKVRQEGGTPAQVEAAYQSALAEYLPPPSPSTLVVSCGRDTCRCTHTHPCDRGWIARPAKVVHGHTYEQVGPCPQCKPEAFDRYARSVEYGSRNVRGL